MVLGPHGPFLMLVLMLASLSSQTSPAPPSEFEIKEWPRKLRTDLREASIKIVLPENALDLPWDDALIAKFHQLTGITVQTVRPRQRYDRRFGGLPTRLRKRIRRR
jgi:hypothetical protein